MKFYSQYKQDEWLYNNHFKDKPPGIFVEIGADDGVDFSNTKFFEELGWSGMCIEPSPERFRLLEENRSCICENYAISDATGTAQFMDIRGYGKGLSGIVDNYDNRHMSRVEREIKHPNNKGNSKITVKTELLSNLLDKHNITKIDFCTIDTEGNEYGIIKTIDFDIYQIDIILVENIYNDMSISNMLADKGYIKAHRLGVDDVFIKYKSN